jgi:glycine C-acetyltransferase
VLYPAVHRRATRVRMSLMHNLTKEHLDTALNVLEDADKKFNITGKYGPAEAAGNN